jgi:NADP-dependent aldehyde dehydrogenase
MQITGEMLIGAQAVRGKGAPVEAIDPASGGRIDADGGPRFNGGDAHDVERACALAQAAFTPYRNASEQARARLLETIAQGLLDCGDALIERAQRESALPAARLQGERQRTVNQLRLFADLLRDGAWRRVTVDRALPERTPPRSDLRQQSVAVGPVAVFGASNFPLAFSVAGGDTASALAAGCPVIVKAHNAHLGTSEIVGRVIQRAVVQCGLPEGVFSLLIDADTRLGAALVAHPAIQAVGFTGSRAGGHALRAIAQARPQPIPVYAEMSAINPVFLLPAALAQRGESLAAAYVDSLALGVGQFCTNPGLVVGIDGPAFERFAAEAARRVGERPAATMLTPGIARAYTAGVQTVGAQPGVVTLANGPAATAPNQASPALWRVSAEEFMRNARLSDEVFGPASLLVVCRDEGELLAVARHLEGQLTATLQLERDDQELAHRLLPVLETKAGRVLANGWPTGVEVCAAMVHGGPYPSTFDARYTSVGSRAIERFVRPVCYQDLPDWLFPESLQPR